MKRSVGTVGEAASAVRFINILMVVGLPAAMVARWVAIQSKKRLRDNLLAMMIVAPVASGAKPPRICAEAQL